MIRFITYDSNGKVEIEIHSGEEEDGKVLVFKNGVAYSDGMTLEKVAEYCTNDIKATEEVYKAQKKVEDLFGPRLFKNSVAIIRTKKGNTVGCHMISTYNYRKLQPNQFVYDGYVGRSFEISGSVGGTVIILVHDFVSPSGFSFTNTIRFENVTEIELMSEHDQ